MQALDQIWFRRLVDLMKASDDVELLQKSLQVNQLERERFFEDEVENPQFKYFYDEYKIQKTEHFEVLLKEIEETEQNETIKSLYRDKIKGQITRINMMHASNNGADTDFYRYSTQLYGKPRPEYFAYVAKRIMELLATADKPWQMSARKRLHQIFSRIEASDVPFGPDILPEPVVEPQAKAISAKTVKKIFLETLARYHISDWHVVVDTTETRRRFSVVPAKKEIYVPSDTNLHARPMPLTRTRTEALAEHEIGVHVRRAYQGATQPLQLLAIGLRGYLRGEEGLASYVQQQIEGAREYYGFDRYLAASVAIGLDGHERDFRSVYAILYDYYTVAATKKIAKENLMYAAWDTTVRIFRGTSAATAGTIFTRDIAYLEGNIGIWQLLIDKPDLFPKLFIGKFDPLDSTQLSALQKLGILSE